MKFQELNVHFCRMSFLALAAVASLLLAGCSGSSSRAPGTDPSAPDTRAATVFGDEISFTGYSIQSRDGHTELELRWLAARKPSADYFVFVHALDSSGAVVFQGDHPLKNAANAGSSSWIVGVTVSDRFMMAPPPGKPAGTYSLRIGVYTVSPMKVLQITRGTFPQPTDDWRNQAVLLANVECK